MPKFLQPRKAGGSGYVPVAAAAAAAAAAVVEVTVTAVTSPLTSCPSSACPAAPLGTAAAMPSGAARRNAVWRNALQIPLHFARREVTCFLKGCEGGHLAWRGSSHDDLHSGDRRGFPLRLFAFGKGSLSNV
eukprot:gene16038-biopygen3718